MNRKAPHLRNDSNPYRQQKNEVAKQAMKENFAPNDLMNVPKHVFIRNISIYESLVRNLDDLGLSLHLKSFDIHSLAGLANTLDLLMEIERELQKYGISQVITTREGASKIVPSPYIQMRNTTLNQYHSQLKALQLTPEARQMLSENVLNDADMATITVEEDDALINKILERF